MKSQISQNSGSCGTTFLLSHCCPAGFHNANCQLLGKLHLKATANCDLDVEQSIFTFKHRPPPELRDEVYAK